MFSCLLYFWQNHILKLQECRILTTIFHTLYSKTEASKKSPTNPKIQSKFLFNWYLSKMMKWRALVYKVNITISSTILLFPIPGVKVHVFKKLLSQSRMKIKTPLREQSCLQIKPYFFKDGIKFKLLKVAKLNSILNKCLCSLGMLYMPIWIFLKCRIPL